MILPSDWPDITDLERKINKINEGYFPPLLSRQMWQEDFSSPAYLKTLDFVVPYEKHFSKIDYTLLVQVIRSQLLYEEYILTVFNSIDPTKFEEDCRLMLQREKMIPRFLKIMRNFQFSEALSDRHKSKYFEITKVTFEGIRKADKIVLEGTILDLLKYYFDVLGSFKNEEELKKLQGISMKLYNSFWRLWFTHIGKLNKVTKKHSYRNLSQFKSYMKTTKAFQFHRFIKEFSDLSDQATISEKEKRFIGDFFLMAGICQDVDETMDDYLDTTHYNDVRNWIERGKYL